eukprot:15473680-Alexandrium_andersonii.AAC.1
MAYTQHKLFSVVQSYPWKLSVGTVRANIAELKASDQVPSDPCAAKVQKLAQLGFSVDRLVEAISLFREVPWSSVP